MGFKTINGKKVFIDENRRTKSNGRNDEAGGMKIGNGTRVPRDLLKIFESRKEITQSDVDREFNDFTQNDSPFSSGDISEAVQVFEGVDLRGKDLAEHIDDVARETGTPKKDLDVTGEAYQFVFNNARNKLDSVLGFDIDEEDFSVSFNFVASGFDQSSEGQDALRERLDNASTNELEELKKDKFVKFFLNNTDVLL
jgi:hypothetical protein